MRRHKGILVALGGLVVIYSVWVLGYLATSPDVRLRCLMVDEPIQTEGTIGIEIHDTPGLICKGPRPEPGDLLVSFGGQRTETFLDFAGKLTRLRNEPIPPGGRLAAGSDPSELSPEVFTLPPMVEADEGERLVKIEYIDAASRKRIDNSWLLVQSLPLTDFVVTLVWFLLQLGIFAVGAFAFWNRPYDRPSGFFFGMCIVTMGSFVAGYHWWVTAGSIVLTVPYLICSILVPSVTLHFFLEFPRPKLAVLRYRRLTLFGLYSVPVAGAGWILGQLGYIHWLNQFPVDERPLAEVLARLERLRESIYLYFAVATVYFVVTLGVVRRSYVGTGNPLERNQLRWIWRAGVLSGGLVAVTLYMALFHRAEFALGGGRLPMFLASLCFMVAYAVGIIRYKLMLMDQIVSKGMLYYVSSLGLTAAFGLIIGWGALLPQVWNISLSSQQALSVAVVLMLSVVLLLWLRDRFQQIIDREFFREKYQLDKALEQMNKALGHLADPEALAQTMLSSCRDVLRVTHSALYLRSRTQNVFQLVTAIGTEPVPLQLPADGPLTEAISRGGSLQRVTLERRSEMSPVQQHLREMHAHLIHPLDVDQGVSGLIVLGEKKNGAPFNAEDLTFLNALGQITNVALYSVKVDQDVVQLNEELRRKVDKISEQKRQLVMLQAELESLRDESSAAVRPPNRQEFRRDAIKGNSRAMQSVLETVRKVATSESSVLIRGESGTGKELLARVLHDNSERRDGPLVCMHCASLSASLLESELFGHVKGSFTGAHRDRQGRFETASGGTLFLDEIGDISLETQVKLLRVLQERRFEPVGSSRTVEVDVRLIAATHQNLEKLIAEGRFREDLYYRLNVISLTLPPLRERKEDIFDLALYFLNRRATRMGKRFTNIEEAALSALERYDWPGNIRELENVVERVVVLAEGETITAEDLPPEIVSPSPPARKRLAPAEPRAIETAPANNDGDGHPALPALNDSAGSASERQRLLEALEQTRGNKAQAARLLGMPRSTYFSKLRKHAID